MRVTRNMRIVARNMRIVVRILLALLLVLNVGMFTIPALSNTEPTPIVESTPKVIVEPVETIIIEPVKPTPEPTQAPKQERSVSVSREGIDRKYIDSFEGNVTAYCACKKCCGKDPSHPEYGITASGKKVTAEYTVAMGKKYPFGTKIMIEGSSNVYVCQDRGSAILNDCVDIYMDDHDTCNKFGRHNLKVYVIELGESK